MKSPNITLTGSDLNLQQVIQVAYENYQVHITDSCINHIQQSRQFIVAKAAEEAIVYGVTTGFGLNADKVIHGEAAIEMQKNLLRSHAVGVGPNFSAPVVRAIMLIRLNTLLQGYSGVSLDLISLLVEFLNRGIHPVIPQQGSVGASGDLCPLSHMALPLIGEGELMYQQQLYSGKKAITHLLQSLGLKPLNLGHKEGLALNNGTTIMAALGVVAVYKAKNLLKLAVLSSCLFFEALGARTDAFEAKIHALRKHNGQQQIAKWIRDFTHSSSMMGINSHELLHCLPQSLVATFPQELQQLIYNIVHKHLPLQVPKSILRYLPSEWIELVRFADKKSIPQDAYSVRCTPQILGASLTAIEHVEAVITNELNAVVDNPIIFTEQNQVISGGNFHGQPLAVVLDYLKLAVAEVGSLLERQVNKLTDPQHNDCLPGFLVNDCGLQSGLMIVQYTAAAIVSENKVLVHPASADSIPTGANQEDHVSMGPIAGRQAIEIIKNVEKILSIHLISAAQAVELRQQQYQQWQLPNKEMATATKALYTKIRKQVSYLAKDRFLHKDIVKIQASLPSFYNLVNSIHDSSLKLVH